MDEAAFRRECARRVRAATSLRERANGDCVFFRRGEGCVVYNVRPTQCRTYPFWPEHMRAPEDWDEAAQECPGMDRGRLHSQAEIDKQLQRELEGESR
jgi:Fe-S-cluster containining protein